MLLTIKFTNMEIGEIIVYKDCYTSGKGPIKLIGNGEWEGFILVEIGYDSRAYYNTKGGDSPPRTCRWYLKQDLQLLENNYQIY